MTIKQLRYFIMALGIFLMCRAFFHSFDHGYDLIFDIRLLQSTVAICVSYLINAVEQILKHLESKDADITVPIPYFQSLDMAPPADKCPEKFVYIKDDACLYRSNGKVWEFAKGLSVK